MDTLDADTESSTGGSPDYGERARRESMSPTPSLPSNNAETVPRVGSGAAGAVLQVGGGHGVGRLVASAARGLHDRLEHIDMAQLLACNKRLVFCATAQALLAAVLFTWDILIGYCASVRGFVGTTARAHTFDFRLIVLALMYATAGLVLVVRYRHSVLRCCQGPPSGLTRLGGAAATTTPLLDNAESGRPINSVRGPNYGATDYSVDRHKLYRLDIVTNDISPTSHSRLLDFFFPDIFERPPHSRMHGVRRIEDDVQRSTEAVQVVGSSFSVEHGRCQVTRVRVFMLVTAVETVAAVVAYVSYALLSERESAVGMFVSFAAACLLAFVGASFYLATASFEEVVIGRDSATAAEIGAERMPDGRNPSTRPRRMPSEGGERAERSPVLGPVVPSS